MATRWDKIPTSDYDVKNIGRDLRAAGKALSPPENVKGAALDAIKAAGVRGGTRGLGAIGAGVAASQLGYDAGRELDEKTGIGKKIVDKSGLGDLAEKVAKPDEKVELSQSAKDRIAAGELDKKPAKPPSKKAASDESNSGPYSGPRDDIGKPKNLFNDMVKPKEFESKDLKKGGKVRSHSSKRGDGIAQRGHTKGRYL